MAPTKRRMGQAPGTPDFSWFEPKKSPTDASGNQTRKRNSDHMLSTLSAINVDRTTDTSEDPYTDYELYEDQFPCLRFFIFPYLTEKSCLHPVAETIFREYKN